MYAHMCARICVYTHEHVSLSVCVFVWCGVEGEDYILYTK